MGALHRKRTGQKRQDRHEYKAHYSVYSDRDKRVVSDGDDLVQEVSFALGYSARRDTSMSVWDESTGRTACRIECGEIVAGGAA